MEMEASVQQAEQAVMDALFGPVGRSDPQGVLKDADIPGVQYSFVHEVLHDRALGSPRVPESADLMIQLLARFLPRLPPARHAAVRRMFSGLFSARRVDAYRETVRVRCEALLDMMEHRNGGDLAREFAEPLPFGVIADVLGVDPDSQDWLRESMAALGRGFAGQRAREPVESGNVATAQMLAYFGDLLARRQKEPCEDLASLLAAGLTDSPSDGDLVVGADADVVSERRADVLANCIFFILAGHATTTTMLCAGLDLLLTRPEALGRLRQEPTGWPACVEEILRYVSPITLTGVRTEVDRVVDGHHLPPGAQRIVAYAAANRDPAVFTDPDTFDPARNPNPHLAFSAGATFCLGAPLARLHALTALPMILNRLPNLHPDGPPLYRGSTPVRQVESYPATW
jgi:pimeloyl-[acyl-carrier protein] synthase